MKKKLTYNPEFDALTSKEQLLLDELALCINEFVETSPQLSKVPYRTRDAHATTYAVLKGKFLIDKDFEEQSVFPSTIMDAVLRISNAHMKVVKGKAVPAYGFSLKLQDKGHTTANFPLVNFPLFPFNNATLFLKMFKAFNRFFYGNIVQKTSSMFSIIVGFLRTLPQILHPSFVKNIRAFIKRRNDFILSWTYHSIGVYRLGNHLVKIRLVPDPVQPLEDTDNPNVAIAEHMVQNGQFTARLFVQYAYNLNEQPVNELNREWQNSEFVPIGSLIFTSALRKNDPQQEMLSFNPFENTEELKPVGKIQQLRKKAYEASYNARSHPL